MQSVVYSSQAWTNFTRAIGNKETFDGYTTDIRQYVEYLKLKDPAELLAGIPEVQENNAVGFILFLKEKGKSVSRIRRIMAAIKLFYVINRITLNWPYILRHVGKGKTKKDKAYTHEQVKKALDVCSPRNKAMMLVYSSSGVRRGALPELRLKNLQKIDQYGIYKITVYEGDEEEYITYCTPECRKAIEEYVSYRERCGEKITPNSLIIRDEFNREDQFRVATPKPISPDTISVIITEIMEKAGVRQRVKLTEGQIRSQIRHEVKGIHGLRKFWDTQMTLSGVSPLWIELLEGHKIKGMKHHYLRPTDEQLLEGNDRTHGYISAIDYLTINEEHRLKLKNEKLEAEYTQLQTETADMLKWYAENVKGKQG